MKEVQENQHNLVWVATPPFMLTYVTKEILAHRTNVVVEAPAGLIVVDYLGQIGTHLEIKRSAR